MFKKFIVVGATILCAETVSAQSVVSGFYISGNVQSEYLFVDDDNVTVSMADFTLGYDGSIAGNMPFGFEIDLLAIRGDTLTIDPNYTGSVYYNSSLGRLSFGIPRTPIDDYITAVNMGGSKLLDLELSAPFSSLTNTMLLFEEVTFDYGVRFDGTVRGVNFGLSYHQAQGKVLSVTGVVSYGIEGNYIASVGFEQFPNQGIETGIFGSLVADYGIYGGVLNVASPTGSSGLVYAAEAFYEPAENIDLTVSYMSVNGESLFSFDVEYAFIKDVYIGASVQGDFSGDPLYTIYAGWNVSLGS